MKCPVCTIALKRGLYEGLAVFHCEQCQGYLVESSRVDDIKKRQITPEEQLQEESTPAGDTRKGLKCPRCLGPMEKDYWEFDESFFIDRCHECDYVWFDPGELARIQLSFENSEQAQEAVEFQDRLHSMSPEDKAEFEKNLAGMPEGEPALDSPFGGAFQDGFRYLFRIFRRSN